MKRTDKKPADAELTRRIQELIQFKNGGFNEPEVADIIENALKLLTDVKEKGDVRVIQTAVRELRYAFRVFAPYDTKRKVTIFGSARTKADNVEYKQAVEFGNKVVKAGYMVITGAGPGIMQAGHEGAGPENSFGVNIRLPWEQSANPVIAEDKKLITFKYFFTRKLIFIRHSDAIALFPGGFGTLDEGYEAITLMQTGKSKLMPLVLVDRPGGIVAGILQWAVAAGGHGRRVRADVHAGAAAVPRSGAPHATVELRLPVADPAHAGHG